MSIGYDALHSNNRINEMCREELGRNPCYGDQGRQCLCSRMTVGGSAGLEAEALKKGRKRMAGGPPVIIVQTIT